MDILEKVILGCTAFIVVVVGILDLIKTRKLNKMHEDITGGSTSTHQRLDVFTGELKHIRENQGKLRRGIATIFEGKMEKFIEWWHSWH